MRCGPRSVCRTRTAGAGLPGCACLLGTAGLRLPGYLCRAAPAACPTTWDRIFLFGWRMCPWVGRKAGPLARRIGRARSGGSARPTGRPPTCGLGRRSSSQRARPTGHSLRRQFRRIGCSLPARHTGHLGYTPRMPLPQSILRSLYRRVDVHSPRHTWPVHGSQMAAEAAPGQPGAFLPAAWAEAPAHSVPGRRPPPPPPALPRWPLPPIASSPPPGPPAPAAPHHRDPPPRSFPRFSPGFLSSPPPPFFSPPRAADGGGGRAGPRAPPPGVGGGAPPTGRAGGGRTLRRHFHRIACSLSARPTGHRGCPSGTSTAPGRRTSQQCPARAAARSQPAFPSPFTAVLPRIVLRLPSQAAPVIQSTPRRR